MATNPVSARSKRSRAATSKLWRAAPKGAVLCGWSVGGMIAFEMARRLFERGRQVHSVLIDRGISGYWPLTLQPWDDRTC